MRILVTGSREFTDWAALTYALIETASTEPEVTVIHGCNPRGADMMAEEVADTRGWLTEHHRADWTAPCRPECHHGLRPRRRWEDSGTYCPAAGDYRNAEMVDAGADVCLAFFKHGARNSGTSDCVARAEAAGITVVRVVEE